MVPITGWGIDPTYNLQAISGPLTPKALPFPTESSGGGGVFLRGEYRDEYLDPQKYVEQVNNGRQNGNYFSI